MKHRAALLLALCAVLWAVQGCAQERESLHNGYYSAVAASFDQDGWKEFITLYIYNNRIITAEYNARNASGLVLSWDVLHLRRLKAREGGVHPNQIIRAYCRELLDRQDPKNIRPLRGDTRFYGNFVTLADAALAQARAGDKAVADVPLATASAMTTDAPPAAASAKDR